MRGGVRRLASVVRAERGLSSAIGPSGQRAYNDCMKTTGPNLPAAALAAALVVLATTGVGIAAPASSLTVTPDHGVSAAAPMQLAQDGGTEPRELQPRYEPVQPQAQSSYNDEYIFGLTRGIAESTLHPVGKILLFPLTVPLDLVLLPFEAIGGLF